MQLNAKMKKRTY